MALVSPLSPCQQLATSLRQPSFKVQVRVRVLETKKKKVAKKIRKRSTREALRTSLPSNKKRNEALRK